MNRGTRSCSSPRSVCRQVAADGGRLLLAGEDGPLQRLRRLEVARQQLVVDPEQVTDHGPEVDEVLLGGGIELHAAAA